MPEALANTVRIAERCQVDIPSDKNHLPNFAVPAPYTLNEYFEHVVREGFTQRLPRLKALHASGALRHPLEDYETRLSYEIEMIKRMEYPGLFPDRLGLHPVRAREEHSSGTGPRVGRGQPRGVSACASPTSIRSTTI